MLFGWSRRRNVANYQTNRNQRIHWNEGRSLTFEIPNGLASVIKILRENWSVEPSPKGTEVVVTMDYDMKDGIINFLLEALVVGRVLKKMLVQNLAGL